MSKGEIYPQKINSDDLAGFIKRNAIIDNTNYLHDKWGGDKDRFYSKVYFAISLSLTILASLFISLISILILLNLLTILLIISAKKHVKRKKRFEENRECMKKSFKEWGLEWRD
ncbi:hypothetical protein KAI32_00865 [Candidatus Pacearchaeota archaeon]|nr:hypothetical protein [Candidatus Pacearchaeota archaeon]